MQTAEFQQPSPQRKPGRSFDSLAFAKRLQVGGAFTREQAEAIAEQIYAALFNTTAEAACLTALTSAGFEQRQAEPLTKYITDYVTLFHGVQNV